MLFHKVSWLVFLFIGAVGFLWPPFLALYALAVPVYLVGAVDSLQRRHTVRRNFPIIGRLRYFFEFVRPELQQYFVESNHSGRPVSREFRSVVYQRAKGVTDTQPFGTQRDVHGEGHEFVHHSMSPVHVDDVETRVQIGGPQCTQPYSASILNISAISYGALSKNAIMALNRGAKEGDFFHNTGEGGLSQYHLQGGDLCWQVGTGYFGCRTLDGKFSAEKFEKKATRPEVKMIEIKISQGAKPGKGGLLPAAKVSAEVAEIRGVEVGKEVDSPPAHTAFTTPTEMLHFIQQLRELSGGKPIGFKLCLGRRSEFFGICKAIVETKIYPDFITVDGAEGGTGAAPLEFANSVGRPLDDGLAFITNALVGFDIRKNIRVLAAGKVFTSFQLLTKLALGADVVNSARGMMMALGCIQALKCNTNKCPVGVATSDPRLVRGLVVEDKYKRVARFQKLTVHALADVVGAMGYKSAKHVRRTDVFRRLATGEVKSYEQIFASLKPGELLASNGVPNLPEDQLAAWRSSHSDAFWGKI